MIRFIASAVIITSFVSCRSTSPVVAAEIASTTHSKKQVVGYDFSGFKTLNAAPKGMICAAMLRAEEAACRESKGEIIFADQCKVLCSIPIATKGKVAGYNFEKFVVADALPDNMVCAAVVSPEQEACMSVGGTTKLAEKCKHLCSVPISPRGQIAGFNFDGPQLGEVPLQPGHFCTQVVRPEEEACRRSKGKIFQTDHCKILCSIMILP